jgi:hypothetical protein
MQLERLERLEDSSKQPQDGNNSDEPQLEMAPYADVRTALADYTLAQRFEACELFLALQGTGISTREEFIMMRRSPSNVNCSAMHIMVNALLDLRDKNELAGTYHISYYPVVRLYQQHLGATLLMEGGA